MRCDLLLHLMLLKIGLIKFTISLFLHDDKSVSRISFITVFKYKLKSLNTDYTLFIISYITPQL